MAPGGVLRLPLPLLLSIASWAPNSFVCTLPQQGKTCGNMAACSGEGVAEMGSQNDPYLWAEMDVDEGVSPEQSLAAPSNQGHDGVGVAGAGPPPPEVEPPAAAAQAAPQPAAKKRKVDHQKTLTHRIALATGVQQHVVQVVLDQLPDSVYSMLLDNRRLTIKNFISFAMVEHRAASTNKGEMAFLTKFARTNGVHSDNLRLVRPEVTMKPLYMKKLWSCRDITPTVIALPDGQLFGPGPIEELVGVGVGAAGHGQGHPPLSLQKESSASIVLSPTSPSSTSQSSASDASARKSEAEELEAGRWSAAHLGALLDHALLADAMRERVLSGFAAGAAAGAASGAASG